MASCSIIMGEFTVKIMSVHITEYPPLCRVQWRSSHTRWTFKSVQWRSRAVSLNEWMNQSINQSINQCMNEWMNECMNERMNAWMKINVWLGLNFEIIGVSIDIPGFGERQVIVCLSLTSSFCYIVLGTHLVGHFESRVFFFQWVLYTN